MIWCNFAGVGCVLVGVTDLRLHSRPVAGSRRAPVLLALVCAGLSLMPAVRLAAADAAKAPETGKSAAGPDAAALQVFRRFVEASGGEAAIRKRATRLTVASFESPSLGIKGTLEMLQSAPRRMVQKMILGNGPSLTMGTDGKVAWMNAPGVGVQQMDGLQRDQFIEESDLLGLLDYPTRFAYATVKAPTKVGEVDCVVVSGISRLGKPETMYFAKDTGLLHRWDRPKLNPASEWSDTQTLFEDYRDVDGVKVPFKISQREPADQAFVLVVTSVKHDVEAGEDRFKQPSP